MTSLKYLGRMMIATNENWPAVVNNLRCTRKKWAQLSSILGRQGDVTRICGSTGDPLVCIINLGDKIHYQPDLRGVPPQVRLLASRDEAKEGCHGEVGIPAFGGEYGINGARGGGGICRTPPERHIPLH